MRQSIFRPAFVIFCLAALVAFALLIALGNWQMRRLAWKEQLVADVNSRIAASPVEAPGPPKLVRADTRRFRLHPRHTHRSL